MEEKRKLRLSNMRLILILIWYGDNVARYDIKDKPMGPMYTNRLIV